MPARILSIGTAVPETVISQERVRDFFAAQPGRDRLSQRLIHAAFDASAIDRRHTVLAQLADPGAETTPGAPDGTDFVENGVLLVPSTGARNDVYAATAPALSASAARAALDDIGMPASAITHVVTVSCTGFYAPGPDYRLVRDLGLSPTVERYHLGFIGCAAAFPGLRLAARITVAQPDAVVLVVCTELCTLHVRASDDPQQIVASSVFADGSAAAVVSADARWRSGASLDLERFATALTGEGETDMVWTIGDEGFEMTLSAEVPRIIGREIRGAVDAFLAGDDPPDAWAVHPGGRSVLDRVESGLDLDPTAIETSRAVLRDHGNMSSATILFILRSLLHDDTLADGSRIAGLAFGPGLTVESTLLTKHSAA
ncbi:putative naringenin-chalcone synthase [Microbacterium terrae]|uniref:Alpha-pyrone synthesis polyketide synthase-like Pks11 n=1 Tax=Microbacterium terrae TaxID=69369 RepID=A0A0M2H270_9MICO|nr:type III polyketide synthase [Microbacterium terrae]KJL40512.1 Alpha-pyrone synthesis polyketide synthase-like Pks11 [Microbacterium terrae]MBP1079163.1 putative naringenin-chalcone synthase [Microbacterium terrae]GLJ98564.1 naringenin-chalcone synthase [Microbacterium terrae]